MKFTAAELEKSLALARAATPGPYEYDWGNGQVETQNRAHFRSSVADRPGLMERIRHYKDFRLELKPPDFPEPDTDMQNVAHNADPERVEAMVMCIRELKESLAAQCYCTTHIDGHCDVCRLLAKWFEGDE